MLEVLDPGPLTSVQEPIGRRAWRHLGVPVGGGADEWSARLANRLVGNPDDAALLEMTLSGPILRAASTLVVALTGRLGGTMDGVPLPRDTAFAIRAGATIRVEPGDGARGYLAVAGGLVVPSVLGSTATDLRTGFGGLDGRALRAGDRLVVGAAAGGGARWVGTDPSPDEAIRIVPGPHAQHAFDALAGRAFTVGPEADRAGVRLAERVDGGGEAPSMALPLGAVQTPPDGRPILMLADRPVTGGYRVPALVIRADVRRVAQLRPGDRVGFEAVSLDQARRAWRRAEDELNALEPIESGEDDGLGWIGSHG